MKISYEWLQEYVDMKLPPAELKKLFTMSGLSVESMEKAGHDHLFEIEVTSNRPDWLSVIGVAREVAALTGKKLRLPAVSLKAKAPAKAADAGVTVRIEDASACQAYTARIIRGVSIADAPAWLAGRISAVGLRPINNVVDVTNFCLFETGEPMHAFDLDKLRGGVIAVRRARKGEKLVTLDGVERTLDESMIVIADAERPVALAGVMGGLDTEVTAGTKNILLEAASFDPISIRRTARRLALATESSYRFERKVALENIPYASDRAASLILQSAGGAPGAFISAGGKAKPRKAVVFRPSRLAALLGVAIPDAAVKRILAALGMTVRVSKKDAWSVAVPDFRNDLRVEVDIIEEVARIYGYDRIPETIPAVIDQPVRLEHARVAATAARAALVSLGAYEIMTYSLMSRAALAPAAGCDAAAIIAIRNPLSGEQEVMRSSLMPGMLGAVLWNANRKARDLKLFELGPVYRAEKNAYDEEMRLSIAVTGAVSAGWVGGERASAFTDLKGMVEVVLDELGVADVAFSRADDPRFSHAACAMVSAGGKMVGVLGEVAQSVAKAYDVKDPVYYAELSFTGLLPAITLTKRFAAIPRHPSVSRDISLVVAKDALHAELADCIRSAAGAILRRVELIDRYTGSQVPAGKVSLTYRIDYQDPARTLEEKDIQDVHGRVLTALEARFGAKLR